jgi:hypothetical protein
MPQIVDLEDVLHELIEGRVAFTVHYPTDESAVVTITESLTNEGLRLAVEHGAVVESNGRVRILFAAGWR